mmetsp:Transcript_14646/g.40708  ORF Transcript_14646/g.40708 Transcript_14646/m.40708 type:complete len:216 (-) Transcript_14646:329-976(-)
MVDLDPAAMQLFIQNRDPIRRTAVRFSFSTSLTPYTSSLTPACAFRRHSIIKVFIHLQNSKQFHVEIQGGSSRDDSPGAAVSVSESGGNDDLSALPDSHLRKGLVPSPDDLSLSDGKGEGSVAIAGGIELADRIKVVEPSGVVGLDGLPRGGDRSGSLLGHLVFEARFAGDESIDTGFGGHGAIGLGDGRVEDRSGGHGGSGGSRGANKGSAIGR